MKLLAAFIACFFMAMTSSAQMVSDTSTYEYGFNKRSIVTDSAGHPYQFAVWSKKVRTGNYGLKPVNVESDSTAFILYKRNDIAESKTFAALPRPPESGVFKTDAAFKFLNLTDINGNNIKPDDLAGKIVVVNFWFIACPICRYEMPELNRLVQSYKKQKDVVFLSIAYDDKRALKRFLKVSPFNYRVVDNSLGLFAYYGVTQCPTSLVIDRTGIIKFQCAGDESGASPYWIRKTIEQIKQASL
jgi:thiol-disulfide isomerase/thioredoxin